MIDKSVKVKTTKNLQGNIKEKLCDFGLDSFHRYDAKSTICKETNQ